jgi:hypothetical protein
LHWVFEVTRFVRIAAIAVAVCLMQSSTSAQTFADAIESIAEEFSSRWNAPGASTGQRPEFSTSTVKLVDPMQVRRITSLDNDNPNSIFYTFRPNFFNIAVDDEWDWYNLINTDRSDFTDTPFTVGKGNTIMETGVTNTRTHDADAHTQLRTLPESLFRYGITDDFELRFKWTGFQMVNQEDPHSGAKASSFGGTDVDVGAKWNFLQQNNWIPMTTLVGGVLLPSGTNAMSGNTVQPHFNLVNGWGIRRYLFLKHQFGFDYLTQPSFSVNMLGASPIAYLAESHPTVDSFHSSISCLYQATKRLGGFVEWFALYGPNQLTTNFADTGFFFYLTPSVQFDGVFGSSIAAADSETLFVKFGFSTRW